MNIHQAAAVCSMAAREKLRLLEELVGQLAPSETPRYQATIDELRHAVKVLDEHYPPTLRVSVADGLRLREEIK